VKDFWNVYRIVVSYKWPAFKVVFFNLLFVIFGLISLLLFIPFLQLIFPEDPSKIQYIERPILESNWSNIIDYCSKLYTYEMQQLVKVNPKQALFVVCISVVIAFILKGVFRYLAVWSHSFVKVAIVRDLRQRLFEKAIKLPISFFTEERKGDLMARINNDIGEIEFSATSMLELVFREPISIVLYLISLIYISPELTMVSLILLPISALVISSIGKSLKRTAKQGQEQMGTLVSSLDENLSAVRVIKAFNAIAYISESFSKINNRHQYLLTKTYRKKDLSNPLNEVLGSVVMIGLVWFGGLMILNNPNASFKGPQFVTFIIVFSQLLRPIQNISTAISNIQKAQVSYKRFQEIMDLEEASALVKGTDNLTTFENEITFRNAGFKYTDEWVFKELNLTIPKGKMVALVGESGSGKSTIADVILRFQLLQEGELLIDGKPIENYTEDSLRKHIGVVNQESILFNDTVRNNIAFGLENVSDDAIIEAAKIAHAHDFIMQLENGYDTNIGERGNKLSGGQKQRISIARTVLRNPSILILDEATSALDSESEKNVHEALENIMQNRTSVVIAHRLSTIKNASMIYVMQKGKLIEQGTHDELLAKQGYYASMYSILLNQ
jgi:subfamily B ATP-binding cassette protein MsbA